MKRLLTTLLLLSTVLTTQAQAEAARANTPYLYNTVIPDYDSKFAEFIKHHDSLREAAYAKPRVQKLLKERNKYNSENQQEIAAATEAFYALNRLDQDLQRLAQEDYSKRFSPLVNLREKIIEVLVTNDFDLVFMYDSNGIKDFIFKDLDTQYKYEGRINKCAKEMRMAAGGAETINLSNASEQEIDQYNEFMSQCKQKILNASAQSSTDITELVIETLGN